MMKLSRMYGSVMVAVLLSACDNKLSWIEEPPAEIPPQILSLDPDSGTEGTEVSILGKSFGTLKSENRVTFNGVEAEILNVTSTEIVVVAPASETGFVEMFVKGKQTYNRLLFTYE